MTKNKITMLCPACREAGSDKSGNHLTVFPSGKFACAVHPGEKEHNRRIIALQPELGAPKDDYTPLVNRPRPRPKAVDLLARIKSDYPLEIVDLWESSPIRCDSDLDQSRAFLWLFPVDAVLWIAPDIYQSGKPEHAKYFRTRESWESETFTVAGTRICPSSFRPGSHHRNRDSVVEHLFAVVESDEIGAGKKYATRDEFCSLLRWLKEACGWHLRAVIDTGGKSLHAWFKHPGKEDMDKLAEYAGVLGLDTKFSEPCQPWRLPGVDRENSDRMQCLVHLDLEAAI